MVMDYEKEENEFKTITLISLALSMIFVLASMGLISDGKVFYYFLSLPLLICYSMASVFCLVMNRFFWLAKRLENGEIRISNKTIKDSEIELLYNNGKGFKYSFTEQNKKVRH